MLNLQPFGRQIEVVFKKIFILLHFFHGTGGDADDRDTMQAVETF